ncbi:T9SS type A sorting domain-containing protein [uncultured Kordia sp.]|uniref:T9SS type A sorting domain-containing protein n=1 Tax=uncultured Kordia sp. TaxID=507699 RepID=UPI00260748DC|nr:T9SS type A sorting domain-containing protein [uncultured Kordia sp.]
MKKTLLSLLFLSCIVSSLHAQQFTEYSVPSQTIFNPREFATGDIDGDGHIDIIVPENTNSSISILYGTGDLSNYTMVRYNLVDPTVNGNMKPWAIVIMDIDEDSIDDIIFSNYANTVNATDGVYWMKNTGNRTLGNVQLIRFHDRCRGIYKGNFDTDARDELVVAGDNNSIGNLKILNVSTNGGSTVFLNYYANRRPLHVTSTDLTNDGIQDLVYTSFGTGSEPNNSTSSTNGVKTLQSPSYNFGISLITNVTHNVAGTRKTVIDDFNENGVLDFIAVSASGTTTSIKSYNPSQGETSHFISTDGSRNLVSIAAGDFDDDNVPDITAIDNTTNEILFFENTATSGSATTNISFNAATVLSSNVNAPTWIDAVDLDGDGDLDILTGNNGGGANPGGFITILRNDAIVLSTPEFEIKNIKVITSNSEVIISNIPSFIKQGELLDINGRLIHSVALNTQNNRISIEQLPVGIYILKLSALNTSFKIVKQ